MMSTIGYENWAVDLAEVGAVYPFQGWEGVMTILGLVFWLGWHYLQSTRETTDLNEQKAKFNKDNAAKFLEHY